MAWGDINILLKFRGGHDLQWKPLKYFRYCIHKMGICTQKYIENKKGRRIFVQTLSKHDHATDFPEKWINTSVCVCARVCVSLCGCCVMKMPHYAFFRLHVAFLFSFLFRRLSCPHLTLYTCIAFLGVFFLRCWFITFLHCILRLQNFIQNGISWDFPFVLSFSFLFCILFAANYRNAYSK